MQVTVSHAAADPRPPSAQPTRLALREVASARPQPSLTRLEPGRVATSGVGVAGTPIDVQRAMNPDADRTALDMEPAPVVAPALEQLAPLPTPAAARAWPSVGPAVVGSRMSDTESVRQTLHLYQRAYERLDVAAAAKVWPSVDRRALARAFGSIRSQGLTFDTCDIQVADLNATARCRGSIEYVRKVGTTVPYAAQQEWLFRMRKAESEWTIADVVAGFKVQGAGFKVR